MSPAAVTVPGTVAEVGTSNSTQYALLANGSLYAWGLGTHGQLGDGGTENSFSKAVRVQKGLLHSRQAPAVPCERPGRSQRSRAV